jgi:sensitive to high expression protein 9
MPLMAMNARQLRASQFLGAYRGLIGQEARGSARLLHINALLRNGNRSGPGENGLSSTRDIGHESEEEEKQRRHGVLTQLRDVVKQKRQTLEPRLKKQLDELGRRWNSYSGYEEVTEAKALVLEAEVQLKELREQQAIERKAYVSAVTRRADSQRNLNELLSRKSTWNEQDLSRYTELLRSEHGDSQHEKETTERFERMGDRVNAAWDDVVRKTLDRYHKEQIWSDRVRATSTYASYAIAGLNGECLSACPKTDC